MFRSTRRALGQNVIVGRASGLVLCVSALAACGGSKPPPKMEEAPAVEAPRHRGGGGASVSQELGSIDQRAVERTFDGLQAKLEACHTKGRSRVEYLAGDVKVFLRIDGGGRVKYAFFEESTLGDRDTERCLLDLFAATAWPKPEGGEAEVRNGFGWPGGSERPPTPWGPEKAMVAIDADKDVKKSVAACKAGTSGDFVVTAYVEPGEPEGGGAGKADTKAARAGKSGKKGASTSEHGGRFQAIGVAPPSKDAAEKVDCIVDALRGTSLPSPGSYAAKVTFPL